MLLSKIDDLITILENKKKIPFTKLPKMLEWDYDAMERVLSLLERQGVLSIHYPLNFLEKPQLILKTLRAEVKTEEKDFNYLESYALHNTYNDFLGTVQIILPQGKKRPKYFLLPITTTNATQAYLNEVRREIGKSLHPSSATKTKEEMQAEFRSRKELIKEKLKNDLQISGPKLDMLATLLHAKMFGLGAIESLLADSQLEEIVINSSQIPVLVYHRYYGWLKTNILLQNEEESENFAAQIARKVGKQITVLNPILDAHLLTGDRVNATLFPISSKGNTITLRLFARNPWTITNYMTPGVRAMSYDIAALLWQAVHYEMNVLVAGGTASGKTSALNGLVSLIPPFQRVISIEDTRELSLPSYQWNWVPLATRPPNPEGAGEIKMLDLLVNSLRMRPDRIVMGEIRRRKEAEVLFEAMHTGHSVYATMHADTGAQVIKRLVDPPIGIPASEVEDVNLIVVQYRDRRKNLRRTLEVCEVIAGSGKPELNHIYRWNARTDKFQNVRPAHKYVQQMNLHTGMTDKEILDDQENKKKILKWMSSQKLLTVEEVGKIMKLYYAEEQTVLAAAEKGMKAEALFK